MPTRVKICGLRRQEDAQHAARLGVDAIGLVFYAPSPRFVTLEEAGEVVRNLPPFINVVGLFVNPQPQLVVDMVRALPIDMIQFQGDESPQQCEQMARVDGRKYPYIKAIRMREDVDVEQEAARYQGASALLLDAYSPGVPGGTGEAFEWSRVPLKPSKPVILAGGLTAQNVAEAIRQVRPYGVDVSGGVESTKGVKDQDKMTAFARAVQQAEGLGV